MEKYKMTTFVDAAKVTPQETRTANGMKTLVSSMDKNVDLFFKAGASRGKDIIGSFEGAFQENADVATRIALWLRDARTGAGERQLFRNILVHLEKTQPAVAEKLLPKVPELGRWDDLLALQTPALRLKAFALIKTALEEGNGLCAKWMPRKGADAEQLKAFLGFSPKRYRKTLVTLSTTVEQAMCAKKWDDIEFGHVPSLAMSRYTKAFARNATISFGKYKEALVKGEAKVNAGALYPYDVIKSIKAGGDEVVALAQWEALPNFVGEANILPMVDVSGSMNCTAGTNKNLQCIDVALSLGLYLADKNKGAFKDCFLTFSTESRIEVLKGNLIAKMRQMDSSSWNMSTSLHSAFDAILKVAKNHAVAPENMPQYVLVLSDMQFNQCIDNDDSAMQMIQRKYETAGYVVPNVIFWNINDSGSVPVAFNEQGAALISGFSPSIMTSVLKAEAITPESVMLTAVMDKKYDY
jgi:hypothetical protein